MPALRCDQIPKQTPRSVCADSGARHLLCALDPTLPGLRSDDPRSLLAWKTIWHALISIDWSIDGGGGTATEAHAAPKSRQQGAGSSGDPTNRCPSHLPGRVARGPRLRHFQKWYADRTPDLHKYQYKICHRDCSPPTPSPQPLSAECFPAVIDACNQTSGLLASNGDIDSVSPSVRSICRNTWRPPRNGEVVQIRWRIAVRLALPIAVLQSRAWGWSL